MPLRRSDITEGFRWILGRGPESKAAIAAYAGCADRAALQSVLIRSEEFRRRYIHLRPASPAQDLALEARRVVFLHIPKCGGTTLRETLAAAFPPELICPERFNMLRDETIAELSCFRFFSGHFDYESCRALPGVNTRIVTLLREPKRRLLSFYYFLKAHRQDVAARENLGLALLARDLAPEQFFAHPSVTENPFVRDTMVRALAWRLPQGRWEEIGETLSDGDPLRRTPDEMVERAWQTLRSLAGFGILEDFARSLALLAQALEVRLTPIRPHFVLDEVMHSSPRLEAVQRGPVTAGLEALLDRLTGLDQILYRRAVALFERRAGEPGDAPPH